MGGSYKFRKPGGRGRSETTRSRSGGSSQARLSRVQKAIRIERLLDPPGDVQARPELLAHEVRELHADSVDIFHRPSERLPAPDYLVDRVRDGELGGRPIRADRANDFEGNELRLRPEAETDWLDAAASEDREGRPAIREDLRPRERDVHVVEDDVLEEDVRARDSRRDLVVRVDDVVSRAPVLPRLPVGKGARPDRPEVSPSHPPRGLDDFSSARESEVQSRRARIGAPRQPRRGERLLEIHRARHKACVVQAGDAPQASREIPESKGVNLLPLWHG